METLKKYWLEWACGILAAALVVCYKRLIKKMRCEKTERKALEAGVQALLRNSIIQSYNKYIGRESIPIYGLENVLSMYEAYHALGGNGAITTLVEQLKALPTSGRHLPD